MELKGLPWLHLHVSSPSSPKGNTKLTAMEQSRHRGGDIKAVVFRNSGSRMVFLYLFIYLNRARTLPANQGLQDFSHGDIMAKQAGNRT